MGDPETEVVLPRIKNDFVQLLKGIAEENLNAVELEIDPRSATTIVLVSGGYPETYEKGKEISGLQKLKDSIPFHAGAKMENGKVITSGGRVIAMTSYGSSYKEALKMSYESIEKVYFDKMYYRKDIGFDL